MEKTKLVPLLWGMTHAVNELRVELKTQQQTANCEAGRARFDGYLRELRELLAEIKKARELVETYKEDRELNSVLYKNIMPRFDKTMVSVRTGSGMCLTIVAQVKREEVLINEIPVS